VSGLKPHIRREVQAFQPMSLTQAISLAKLQEDKSKDRPSQFIPRRPLISTPSGSTPAAVARPPFRHSPTPPHTPPQSPTPIKRLTPQELQILRKKGLCYNCDEKYAPGHRCKRSFHILIA